MKCLNKNLRKITRTLGLVSVAAMSLLGCSDNSSTAGGTSVDGGIYAISNKKIAGVAQKGPFVKGSEVTLQETSGENLEPSGNVYTTTVKSDKGDFDMDSIFLGSQYALLNVNGQYTSEIYGWVHPCKVGLNGVTNLENRKQVNINILTHLEYKRVLNLVRSGKDYASAKKQAESEIARIFYFDGSAENPEELDVFGSTGGDLKLLAISAVFEFGTIDLDRLDDLYMYLHGVYYYDEKYNWDADYESEKNMDDFCQSRQDFLDSLANDIADDGKLGNPDL